MSPLDIALSQGLVHDLSIVAATPESPRNDTANVVELPDGRLIIVWDRFTASEEGGTDFGKADIACAYSTDGAHAWSEPRIIVRRDPGDVNAQAPALCLLPGGELLLGVMHAHARDSSSLRLYRSSDLGASWRAAGSIWERSTGQWLQGGAAGFVRLVSGRLIFPFHGGRGGQWDQHNTAGFWLSDDDGKTWRKSESTIDLPMRGAMEASVAELPGGRLIVSLRSQLGSVFLCASDDRAETWSLPWSAGLTAPESCTCLRLIPGTDHLLLIWNGCEFYEPAHHHYGQRTPLSLARSRDGGRTWERLGDLVHAPDTAFTNLNCTFTRGRDAIITYWLTHPAFSHAPGHRSDLRSAIVSRAFWDELSP